MDFSLSRDLQALAKEAEEVATEGAGRRAFPEDGWLIGYDKEFTEILGRRGWIGMTWPATEGGHGRTALERFVVYEQLVKHGAPVSAGWMADRQIGPTLLQFGSEDQRRRWLPEIIAGRSKWCVGISEPDAGSDVAAIFTKAERRAGNWIVNGRKVWTSGAAYADWCYLIARTDRDAPPQAGLSEFVVDMRSPGIEVHPIKDMTGNEHFCEVVLTDVEVPVENLVGQENASFRQLMRQLEHERGGIDRLLANYGLYRDIRSDPGAVNLSDPLVRQEVAAIESGYRIGRLMMLKLAMGQAGTGYSAATKTFGTEFEQRVADFCVSRLGAASMLWGPESGLGGRAARGACYSPAYTIMGGTVSILRNILGERALGLPR